MGGKKLLLVEDSADLAELFEKYFEMAGFAVTVCDDGTEALAAFAREEFTAVVSDFTLPDMTGLDVLEKIRAVAPKMPFLMLTGRHDGEIEDRIEADPHAAILHKPIAFIDLLNKVKELCQA